MDTPAALSTNDQPRVLIVENEPDARRLYVELLIHWNYQPYPVHGTGEQLIERAKAMAQKHRCHLALVDMRLMDNEDPEDLSGLELVPELEPTKSIIVSGFPEVRAIREGITTKGALSFVGKNEPPERLKEVLDKAALDYCASRRDISISPKRLVCSMPKNFFPNETDVPKDEVEDILARLYPGAKRIQVKSLASTKRRSLDRVPRPRSHILLVRQDDKQPEVVKLARAHKIHNELDRYKKYIEGRLVGLYCPPLRRWEVLWDIGGAVYPLMGATTQKTFAEYYARTPVETIQAGLTEFFTQTCSDFYAAHHRSKRKISLFDAYCQVWEHKWYDERLEELPKLNMARIIPSQWKDLPLINPIEWFHKNINQPDAMPLTITAITHGDLHGDNMFVDSNRHIWVIDFERSGEGPILQDFIELEADILTRLVGLSNDDFASLYMLGVWVAGPARLDQLAILPPGASPRLQRAMRIIATLRCLATECTGETDANLYLWGLLFDMLFLAGLQTSKSQRRGLYRTLMLASIFCHRLDQESQNWPPLGWPPIFPER